MSRDSSTRRSTGVVGGGGGEKTRRSGSDASSAASDILVAAPADTRSSNSTLAFKQAQPLVRVEDGRILIIRTRPRKPNVGLQAPHQPELRLSTPGGTTRPPRDDNDNDNNNNNNNHNKAGPNSRGTYSREYTQQHPEIEWVHRGQGRYLPVSEVRREIDAHRRTRSVDHPLTLILTM